MKISFPDVETNLFSEESRVQREVLELFSLVAFVKNAPTGAEKHPESLLEKTTTITKRILHNSSGILTPDIGFEF